MEFLTNEKLTIVGAAGMIGSNMAQTAMMMKLTPNICLYDPFAPALEGVAEELYHCGFEGVNLTYTSDIKEALTGASYIVSSFAISLPSWSSHCFFSKRKAKAVSVVVPDLEILITPNFLSFKYSVNSNK